MTARSDLGPSIDVREMFDDERDRLIATLEGLDVEGSPAQHADIRGDEGIGRAALGILAVIRTG